MRHKLIKKGRKTACGAPRRGLLTSRWDKTTCMSCLFEGGRIKKWPIVPVSVENVISV